MVRVSAIVKILFANASGQSATEDSIFANVLRLSSTEDFVFTNVIELSPSDIACFDLYAPYDIDHMAAGADQVLSL